MGTAQIEPHPTPLQQAVSEQEATAREQLSAAWQLHIERVQAELQAGWEHHIERVVAERFAELRARLEQELSSAVEARLNAEVAAAAAEAQATERQRVHESCNQLARSLRQAEREDEVYSHLLNGAAALGVRALLLEVSGSGDTLKGVRTVNWWENTPGAHDLGQLQLATAGAPALAHVIEGQDTVVTLPAASELSNAFAAMFPETAGGRVYLFPVMVARKVAAILCAAAEEGKVDVAGLELATALAGGALDARRSTSRPVPATLVALSAGAGTAVKTISATPALDWASLNKEDQDLHLRAQRFARVHVAEIRLYQANAVKSGRAQRNLYGELKAEIDSGREAFRRDFVEACASMPDYFHLELVRTLANDDPQALGPDYPGPLV
jgi:hypothetical protein